MVMEGRTATAEGGSSDGDDEDNDDDDGNEAMDDAVDGIDVVVGTAVVAAAMDEVIEFACKEDGGTERGEGKDNDEEPVSALAKAI